MYGWGNLLSSLVTGIATPAIGGVVGEMVGDTIENQLIKELTETTTGALAGAAVGGGLGALTGGREGAIGGMFQGAVGGGLGGYNAENVAGMFGLGDSSSAPIQGGVADQFKQQVDTSAPSAMGGVYANAVSPQAVGLTSIPSSTQTPPGISPAVANAFTPEAVGLGAISQPTQSQGYQLPQTAQTPRITNYPKYTDLLMQNKELLMGAGMLANVLPSTLATEAANKKQLQDWEAMRARMFEEARQSRDAFRRSHWGFADGGPVDVGTGDIANTGFSMHVPAWAQEKVQRSGGLAALQQKLANGGYVNTNPVDPDNFYPMSQIPRAAPYPASSPIRHEVVSYQDEYAHGGLIDGPGDGQSDDIPANISGKEPVRVADGEYVVPKHIAEKYGEDALHRMMTKVRASAHAKKGKQIVQDAGKRAFINALTGMKA